MSETENDDQLAASIVEPHADTPPSALLQKQTFFALWLWLTVPSNFFSLSPQADATTQVTGWPTGTALQELQTGLATISATNGSQTLTTLMASIKTLLETGSSAGEYTVTANINGEQQVVTATINWGVLLAIIKELYDTIASGLQFYDEDPSCRVDEILSLLPTT
jgi:hypothetical protein